MSETTPDTIAYLILGLVATVVLLGGLVMSMVVRYRNLQKDLRLIEQLDEQPQH